MKLKIKQETVFLCAAAIFVLFCFFTIILAGDDFLWYYAYEKESLESWRMPNGRYLSNVLTYFMVRYVPVRFALYIPLLLLLIWLMCRGLQITQKSHALTWCGLVLFCFMPASNWCENIMWTSAFPVYVIPMLTAMLFLKAFFSEGTENPVKSKLLPAGMLLIGFAGALCVEHMTIYSCLLAAFALIYSGANKKLHIRAYQITYAVGTAAGTVLMFLNHNYYSIAQEGDTVGARRFEFSTTDIFFQMYQFVIPRFAKHFPFIHILLFVGFLILLLRADRSGWTSARKRYVKLTILCAAIYTFYSIFTTVCVDLVSLTPVLRVAAVESALAFLYLVSLSYLSWLLLPRSNALQAIVYIVSAFIVSAFFCVVYPANARCFFADFCFWMLLALAVWNAILQMLPQLEQYACKITRIFALASMAMLSYINIINKVVYEQNIKYMQEQSDRGVKRLELVSLPYNEYSLGYSLESSLLEWANLRPEERETEKAQREYMICISEMFGFNIDLNDFNCRTISYFDYNM